MAEYVEIKHVDNLHIVINNSETRREEVEQENTRLREEIRNLKSQVRQLTQSSEVWSYVGDKIGFQVLARRNRLLWQGSVSRLECLGRVSFVGVVL